MLHCHRSLSPPQCSQPWTPYRLLTLAHTATGPPSSSPWPPVTLTCCFSQRWPGRASLKLPPARQGWARDEGQGLPPSSEALQGGRAGGPLCVPPPSVLASPPLPPAVPPALICVPWAPPALQPPGWGFRTPRPSQLTQTPSCGSAFWHHLPSLGDNHSGERWGSTCPTNAGVLAFWGPFENLMKAMSLHPRNSLAPFSPTSFPEGGARLLGCIL